ncbi:hypothetical protein F1188_06515 [Roseospira marina]|uniref:Nucleoside phosphorylase domain-containing protein n=1 Tax=Roseospira marina TaxID=140057 RepID=A0A5M6IEI0_9PROT|nr:hypothetical protein [Roseospira marina]KAA5606512.1 hypothetical protein F1188_06515 [Roseospira marina]MBB4314065.1 adenosylhomocysteine nucleosidase [Roseospira marina]MBB5087226.1 adenosylhomocysteine nucleosidase [Roseospira marina]
MPAAPATSRPSAIGVGVGVVTGLASEAHVLAGRDGLTVLCHGPGPERATAAARALLDGGARALVSAGICGGLDPALVPGSLVVPARVVSRHAEGESWVVDPAWHAAVVAALPPVLRPNTGTLLGSDRAVASRDGKQALAARSGAVAVDMESHAVARVAAEAGVPFLALRTVADTASDVLPPWLAGVLNRDGTPNAGMAIRRLLTGPWRVATLIALARRSAAAEAALGTAASALGAPATTA